MNVETLAGTVRFKLEALIPGVNVGLWDISNWDVAQWAGILQYVDITDYMLMANTTRGRDRWEDRMRTGVATIFIDNQDGFFDPDTSPAEPGTYVRLSMAVPGGPLGETFFALFTGRIDSITDIAGQGGHSVQQRWDVYDAFADFSNFRQAPGPRQAELTSDRVLWLLDEYGWTFGTDVLAGTYQMQVIQDTSESWLELLQLCAQAEGGEIFITPSGSFAFRPRDWITNNTFIEFEAGNPLLDDVLITSADINWDRTRIRNDVQLAIRGGQAQRFIDQASVGRYGQQTFQLFTFENSNPADMIFLGNRMLSRFSNATKRVEGVTLEPLTQLTAFQVGSLELLNNIRVTVPLVERNIIGTYVINRISHSITPNAWECSVRIDQRGQEDLPPSGFSLGYDQGF